MYCLDLGEGNHIFEMKMICLFREQLALAGAIEALFNWFDTMLHDTDYIRPDLGCYICSQFIALRHLMLKNKIPC
ncbi:hypothetical protein BBA71_11570 [Acetobacter pasteurianus]|nr:hypothetical protein BBA71_11570 [Acetobacter pasteurianus]